MTTVAPTPHDVWFGSAIIARALKDGLDDESARAWFTPGDEFNHVCAMTGKSPAAVQALASGVFQRGDTAIVDRLITTSEGNKFKPQRSRRSNLEIDDNDPDQPLSANKVDPVQPCRPKLAATPEVVAVHCDAVLPPLAKTPPRGPKPIVHFKGGRAVAITYKGDGPHPISYWSTLAGLSKPSSFIVRLKRGCTMEQALGNEPRIGARFRYEHEGQMLTVTEIAKRIGITRETLYSRIRKGLPFKSGVRVAATHSYNGEALTLSQWEARSGVPVESIRNRLRIGWSFGQAIGVEPRKIKRGKVKVYRERVDDAA